ncbi:MULTISPECIES: hypothetical protein [Caballeronia]|uniref:hypothetical protein n=1 Tax=Caballeronia TaxID=1827195 RepID=UPI001FD2716E|nr:MULTISPECIES: hypothetical protein [Caballeronia]MDR5798977.1 hypothetical protein [Caballeronia sp. LZ001]
MTSLNAKPAQSPADLAIFRSSRSSSPVGTAMRAHLGMSATPPADWRGDAPAFSMEQGKMTVRNWDTSELLPEFKGIAYDYMARAFVSLGFDGGERSINYLLSRTCAEAKVEAAEMKNRFDAIR